MTLRQPTERVLDCDPLTPDQAQLLVAATPGPVLVCDVEPDDRFRIVAASGLFSRIVTGASHPAGPRPGESLRAAGFGLLGVDLVHVAQQTERVVTEIPVGDEPRWFEMVVSPIRHGHQCAQVVVVGADRTADHDVEARQRRAARRFEAMIEHAPGLVFLVDSSARIIRTSPNAANELQLDGDLDGRQLFELVHPDTLHSAAAAFGEVLIRPGDPVPLPSFRLVRRSGATMWCEATATNLLHDDDVAAIVINATDVTEQRIAQDRLAIAVTRDETTGLANRRGLQEHLDHALERAIGTDNALGMAVVVIDGLALLDGGAGEQASSAALASVATRIEALAGDAGFIARTGPERLAVAIGSSGIETAATEIERLAGFVHGALREPVVIGRDEVLLRACVGTATARPDDGASITLYRSAEVAALRAMAEGPDTTIAFTEEIRRSAEERLRRVTELQRALRTERLRVAYQPVIGSGGEIVGAEALLRWERNGELLTPAAFLALAEETGLIVPIGAWVVDRACADAAVLRRMIPTLDWVSVNISAQQVRDERFPMLVHNAMDDHGVEPGALALEIDDDAVTIGDRDSIAAAMAALHQARLLVACRDLAGDQRILDRLGALPISAIKLDRHLVGQLDVEVDSLHASLVGATIDLASELGVEVIAQGVETEGQARRLGELGATMMQGFHFAPPMDLASLLTRARARSHQRT